MTRPERGASPLVAGVVLLVAMGLVMVLACTQTDDDTDPDAAPPSLAITDPVVAEPAGPNTALYLTIENDGAGADSLVAARTEVAERVELHETRADDDGLMAMHHLDRIDLPGESVVRLQPGGLHVMLFEVDDLVAGDVVEFELELERSGTVIVEAVVESYAAIHD